MKGRQDPIVNFLANSEDSVKLTRGTVVSIKRPEDEVCRPKHVFTLTESEVERRVFQLRYHTWTDAYYRLGVDTSAINGWEGGIYTSVNVHRHVEDGLAYLTRKSGHREASISWKVDLTDTGLVVDSIQALTLSRTLNGGQVRYDIVSPETTQREDNVGYVTNGWQSLYLIAYLSGSTREDSYDETQLLYQDAVDDQYSFPLDILITLKPLEQTPCMCLSNGEENQASSSVSPLQYSEVFSPPIQEKCTCFFPSKAQTTRGNLNQQSTGSIHDDNVKTIKETHHVRNNENQAEPLSMVSKHQISLPGTPIHRKHYGSKVSTSGSGSRHKLNNENRTQAGTSVQQDHPRIGSARTDSLKTERAGSESELRELKASNLEAMGQGQMMKMAWRVTQQREEDSLQQVCDEEDGTHARHRSRGLCKGALCVIL